jgi:hypothetical protein
MDVTKLGEKTPACPAALCDMQQKPIAGGNLHMRRATKTRSRSDSQLGSATMSFLQFPDAFHWTTAISP